MRKLLAVLAVLGVRSSSPSPAQSVQFVCDQTAWLANVGAPDAVEDFGSFTFDYALGNGPVPISFGTLETLPSYAAGAHAYVDVYPFPGLMPPVSNSGTTHVHAWVRHGSMSLIPLTVELRFDRPASAFGGWFYSAFFTGEEILQLDAYLGSNLVGSQDLDTTCNPICNGAGCPDPVFFGLFTNAPNAFDRIEFRGHTNLNLGIGEEFTMDDLAFVAADCVPALNYCTSGVSVGGCAGSLSSNGIASASASSGFTLQLSGVDGQRNGLVYYSRNVAPPQQWAAGSSSFYCVGQPTQRSALMSTGGSNGVCNGGWSFDWSAFVSTTPLTLGAPRLPGDTFYAQCWVRDPASPKASTLSNAVRFALCP